MDVEKNLKKWELATELSYVCLKLEGAAIGLATYYLAADPLGGEPELPQELAQQFLEYATAVGLRLRALDRAGVPAFDIKTAEKQLKEWETQISNRTMK